MSGETRKRGDAIATADDRRHTETVLATGEAPAASPANGWRLAEGAAPRREGDDLSPEEAIRLGRGHEPAASPEPVAWEMWRDGERVYTAVFRRDMVRSMEQGYEAKPLVYAEPTPNSETESALLKAQEVTAKQARDPSLWFKAMTGNEVRFQKALLELHQVIDGDDFLGNFKLADIARTAIDQARGD